VGETVEYITVDTDAEVDTLAGLILDPARTEAVVCLTSRQRQGHPALDPADVRDVVGDGVPVYFLLTGPLTRELSAQLPPTLDVYGGAGRLWWPGVTGSSDPHDHPLIHDRYDVYGTQALSRLRTAWARGQQQVDAGSVEQDSRVTLLIRERDEARSATSGLRAKLAAVEAERDEAQTRAAKAERAVREQRRAARSADSSHEEPLDVDGETAFHVSVVEAWAEALSSSDHREHPLGRYRLGTAFLASLARLADPPIHRVAWVCAMVACERAQQIGGLALHPLRTGSRGDDSQHVRSTDGAKGWRCALKRSTPAAPRLHFWKLDDGTFEFASVGPHDEFGIPE